MSLGKRFSFFNRKQLEVSRCLDGVVTVVADVATVVAATVVVAKIT